MSKGSLYERLRAATRPLHDELERSVNIGERLASRAKYVDYLMRLWRLHVAAEKSLQELDLEAIGFVYPYPYRSALLEDDLAHLGVSRKALASLVLPAPLCLDTVPAGLGCLYVVEGSAKGARAILPEIKRSLGLDRGRGATFFYGFGRETGQLWRTLLDAIDEVEADSPGGDVAVGAAIETFVMFHEGLVTAPEPLAAPVCGLKPERPNFSRSVA